MSRIPLQPITEEHFGRLCLTTEVRSTYVINLPSGCTLTLHGIGEEDMKWLREMFQRDVQSKAARESP